MTAAALCDGIISSDPTTGAALCSTGWYSVAYNAFVPFDISQLDPAALATAFAAGFSLLGGIWCVCKGCELVFNMIKKA